MLLVVQSLTEAEWVPLRLSVAAALGRLNAGPQTRLIDPRSATLTAGEAEALAAALQRSRWQQPAM